MVEQRNVGGRPPNVPVKYKLMRQAREKLGMSRAQVVERMRELGCPVSRTAVYEWERGGCAPTKVRLAAWCGAVKMNVNDVVDESAAAAS